MLDDDAWDAIESVLEEGFPGHEWTDATGPAYRLMLAGFEAPQILEAIAVLGRKQQSKFRPSVGELLGELHRDPTQLQWTQIEDWLLGREGVLRRPWPQEELVAAAAQSDPVLASWMAAKDIDRMREMNYDEPVWGQKRRDDLRAEWDRWRENATERQARGLELAMGPRSAGLLGRANVAGVIEAGRRAIEAGPTGEEEVVQGA